MADIAKDTFNKSLRQRKVVFQQKKPLLNYELNLAQDILKESLEEFTKISIGDNFSGDSFKVVQGRSGFTEVIVKKGTFYQNGIPVYLNQDVLIGVDVIGGGAASEGGQTDIVYATWRVEQINGPIDPLIGFVTTQEQRIDLKIMYESGVEVPTLVDPDTAGDIAGVREEKIEFVPDVNQIVLARGFFPDWLRIPGTRFTTNTILNPGNPYFTVVSSSADGKTLIVDDGVSAEELKDVRFIQYDPSGEIKKEFRATRDNVINLATIKRPEGTFPILESYIIDAREATAKTYVIAGCVPTFTENTLEVNVSSGKYICGGDLEFLENQTTVTVEDDSLNYIFLTEQTGGSVFTATQEPTSFYTVLAEVVAKNGVITNLRDLRKFEPIATKGGGGDSSSLNTGEPGPSILNLNTVTQNFISGESSGNQILKYNTVFIDPTGKVKRSSCLNKTTMPVVAIAVQDTLENQINNFVTYGVVKNSAWNWSAGDIIYASSSFGGLIDSSGVESLGNGNYVQRIGVALNSTEILFNPDSNYYKIDTSAEVSILVLKENGDIEVIGQDDKISPDRLSSFATLTLDPIGQGVRILSGRYFADGNKDLLFSETVVNMGPSGSTYRTSAISAGFFNKVYFTLDDSGTLKMYEGVAKSSLLDVLDPVIPDNEIPLSIVVFQDNGAAEPGTIGNISKSNITDKRNWINTGITEASAFKPHYKNENNFIIQKGEAWFNKKYVKLNNNTTISVPSVGSGTRYIYLNLNETTGDDFNKIASASSFSSTQESPLNLDQRIYVLLGTFDLSEDSKIVRNSFRSFDSKFWEYRDTPFVSEQIYQVDEAQSDFTITNFVFKDTDFLEVLINGDLVFEGFDKDYTKNSSNPFTVNFNYPVLTGASVRIRKL